MRVKFWFRSRRGASGSEIVELRDDTTDAEIKDELESWCSRETCDLDSVNYRYGFECLEGKGETNGRV
jgi:hypothetical protein